MGPISYRPICQSVGASYEIDDTCSDDIIRTYAFEQMVPLRLFVY